MKAGKAPGTSEVSLEMIATSGRVMAEVCQGVLDGFGTQFEWALSIVFPIFKGKDDIRNCSLYRAVWLLEH